MKDKQEEFLNIYDACIHREGAAALREYLFKSDFFRAPASTRYHCAYEGGLCEQMCIRDRTKTTISLSVLT